MAEVLRVKAKPGVLVTDYRALPARRFIGRASAPQPASHQLPGALAGGKLYDPSLLHSGDPVDVDEAFPIKEDGHELSFEVDHKHSGVRLSERKMHAKYKALVAEGALLPADEETAKKCGVSAHEEHAQ